VSTTTIRVDIETHARLLELGERRGASLLQTVRDAAEALRRQEFASQVAAELDALRADPVAWADYIDDAESSGVADGLD
jgi:hypothetical protein